MQYLAILGRQPDIGRAELMALLGIEHVTAFGDHALLDSLPDINHLGGTIKLARVIGRQAAKTLDDLSPDWLSLAGNGDGSIEFAVSCYGLRFTPARINAFGLTAKKLLKTTSRSIRYVAAKDGAKAVTAAQLKYNHIPERGFELIIVGHQGQMLTAVTETVQDIDAYTARDQARPGRDARVGMLPPKLAQILVNLAASDNIYDPFCGSGVILQEALLMDKQAAGSDLDPAMVKAASDNMAWLHEVTSRPLPIVPLTEADARRVTLPPGVSIASEGYLGPALSAAPMPTELSRMQGDVAELVIKSLKNFAGQLTTGHHVVLCLPAWRIKNSFVLPQVIDQIPDLGYTLLQFAPTAAPLVYHREGQYVGRAILILRKN